MRMGIIREIWKRVEEDLETILVNGQEAQVLSSDLDELRAADIGTSVRLLPYFDAYLLGHKAKGHLVDPAHYKRVYRKAGWISQTVLLDGRVAGVWTQKVKRKRLRVTVEPFEPLDREARRGVKDEAADLGRFRGQEAEVLFSS
jgi:hypothetical protein